MELVTCQDEVTHHTETGYLKDAGQARRNRGEAWKQIAADWRAMVEALEASEKTLDAIGGLATVKDSGVITLLPYYARKLAKMLNETLPTVQAVLARVKGE